MIQSKKRKVILKMDRINDKEYVLEGHNISFGYRDKTILDNLNFSFEKGEHIGIIGESGCGKSTFLKILAGLLTPNSGELWVNKETETLKIRKQISMVMQDAMIMPLTVKENITLGHEISDERLNEILKATKLDEWLLTLHDGVNTYLGKKANELSGGQAQRIAIARAMAKNSDIILLDEPTSALDKTTGALVLEALSNLTKGKTVVQVTHSPDMLKDYDRIIRMENGQLL